MPARHPSPRPARRVLVAALSLLVLPCSVARAQWLGGVGEDARVMPRGTVRVTVEGQLSHYDERYDAAGERVPVAGALADADLSAAAMPVLQPLQAQAAALGVGDLRLTLGRLDVAADVSRAEIPVRFDVGLGARLQLSATIPYVQTHVAVRAGLNPNASEGNLGINPALAGGDAMARNDQVVSQLRAAAAALRAQLDGCATGAGAPACADPEAASALATSAEAYAASVAVIYGGSDGAGSAVVPIQVSDAGAAVLARLGELRTQLATYGITGIDPEAAPVGAVAPLTLPDLQQLLAAPGLGLERLRNVSRYGIGDVEVGARFALRELPLPVADAPRPALAWRATLGALVRLGTGRPDDPANLLDVGIGDGQHDVELSALADLFAGRLGTSVVARYGMQLADERELRVPAGEEVVIPASATLTTVSRDLGDYVELELTPRYALTHFLGVAAHYRFRAKGADRYTSAGDGADPAALARLGAGTESREQILGGGLVLSTLAAVAAGEMRTPLEVWYRHTVTIAGRGTTAVHAQRDEVALRVYLDIFGGARRR
ncbi:MAG TPA: hypothetical protein VFS08_13985 [Gemmatimonadaceae bacterium]|nr:hypothetical protein [Gemmatimonadaceae bacterium]